MPGKFSSLKHDLEYFLSKLKSGGSSNDYSQRKVQAARIVPAISKPARTVTSVK